MNKERILELADVIEAAPDESFDMAVYSQKDKPVSCDSPGCIAGWAVTRFAPNSRGWGYYISDPIHDEAQEILGLDDETATRLFRSTDRIFALSLVPKSAAVAVLRHLAKTGEVDWDRFELPKADSE